MVRRQKLADELCFAVNKHYFVKRNPNPLFTGRQDLLEDIEKALEPARTKTARPYRPVFVLSGMGGEGKSESAVQTVHKCRER
jgi:hypothetical protein